MTDPSNRLRAPDPTLTSPTLIYNDDGEVQQLPDDFDLVSVVWADDGPATACVRTPNHFNGRYELRHWVVLPLRDAAYVAVPCRECFPDAPPPTARREYHPTSTGERVAYVPDPNLAWQLEDAR